MDIRRVFSHTIPMGEETRGVQMSVIQAKATGLLRRIRRLPYRQSIAYWMIAPFFLLFTIFVLLPILFNIILSFFNYNLRSLQYVGLKNYTQIFQDYLFAAAMKNTAVYVFWTVSITMVLSFSLALMVNRATRTMRVMRSLFYIPNVVSMVAVATVWQFMYNPYFGIFNVILKLFGLPAQTWLLDTKMAMGCIIIMTIWKSAGYNMVLFLAGLQGVPQELYESAAMDGAHGLQMTWHITLPCVAPVTFFVFVTNCISSFSVFDQVQVLTRGGPMNATTTIVHQIYNRAFSEFRLGYAAAMAIVLAAIIFTLTALSFRMANKSADYE